MRRPFALLIVSLASSPLLAQSTWNPLAPAVAPPGLAGAQGVSDGNEMFLFGGNTGTSNPWNADVWAFDGTNWSIRTPASASGPVARDWHAACWDAGRGRLVVFGGRDASNTEFADTWEWDGANWIQFTPAITPSARRWAAMEYDAARGVCVLFGGSSAGTYLGDTWTWDGAQWTQLAPAVSPSARGRGRMAYDPNTQEIMYFGGRAAAPTGETWFWNGTTWRQQVTTTIPGPTSNGVFAAAMVYDLFRRRFVLFGGTVSGPTLGNTYEYVNGDWVDRGASGIGGRTFPTMAYVASFDRTFLFGGFSSTQLTDTNEYVTSQPASVVASGTSCPGSQAMSFLTNDGLPWIGQSFDLVTTNVGFNPAIFLIGISNQMWGAIPLPLGGGPFGAPGCNLYVSPDLSFNTMAVNGECRLTGSIPQSVTLVGGGFFAQALVFDPPANTLGFTFTNYVTATIGYP